MKAFYLSFSRVDEAAERRRVSVTDRRAVNRRPSTSLGADDLGMQISFRAVILGVSPELHQRTEYLR